MNHVFAAVAAASLLGALGSAQALTIKADPILGDSLSLGLSEVLSVDFASVDFPLFTSGEINLTYDPTVISIDVAGFGDFALTSVDRGGVPPVDASTGLLTRTFDFSRFFDGAVEGDVELFTLVFEGVGSGDTPVTIAESAIGFASGTTMLSEDVEPIALNVTVAPIPAPATLPLLLAGLGGLVAMRRGRT